MNQSSYLLNQKLFYLKFLLINKQNLKRYFRLKGFLIHMIFQKIMEINL
jgi:hypothetical protein